MATAIGRRGSDDRRPPVLAPPETGRVRGEASLPAHRAGGRIPVGGAGLRARLAYITAATTAVAALAFLVPLGFELRHNHREQVLASAERQSSRIVGALSAGAGPKGLAAALNGVSDRVKVHAPGETAGGRAPGEEVQHAATSGSTVTENVDGGLVRL